MYYARYVQEMQTLNTFDIRLSAWLCTNGTYYCHHHNYPIGQHVFCLCQRHKFVLPKRVIPKILAQLMISDRSSTDGYAFHHFNALLFVFCCCCFFSNMKVKNIITTQELFFEIKVIPKITGTNITPPLGNIFFPLCQ